MKVDPLINLSHLQCHHSSVVIPIKPRRLAIFTCQMNSQPSILVGTMYSTINTARVIFHIGWLYLNQMNDVKIIKISLQVDYYQRKSTY